MYDRKLAHIFAHVPTMFEKNRLKIRGFMVKTLTCGRLLGQPLYTIFPLNIAPRLFRSLKHLIFLSNTDSNLAILFLIVAPPPPRKIGPST